MKRQLNDINTKVNQILGLSNKIFLNIHKKMFQQLQFFSNK